MRRRVVPLGRSTLAPVDATGVPMVVTTFRDIADRQRRDKVIQHRALTDPLTGVATRTVLMDRMHQGIRRLERGELPASFLEVAQHAGLLIRLDTLVLGDALARAAAWHQRFPKSAFSQVSVNVTARHLADIGFHAAVMDQLAMHSVPSNWLTLELTEQVLMEASNSAMTGLRALRDAGVGVSLDDFGTGYSSLSYLRLRCAVTTGTSKGIHGTPELHLIG